MRVALAVVTGVAFFSGLFFWAGAVVAYADPSFVLTQSAAGPGDRVHFSISGTESRATYSLEVDGEEVAEGSVPAGSGASDEFTMPDLGNTSRALTVEAQIKESDETTTREHSLRYLAPSQASSGPTGPQPAFVLAAAPAAESAPASGPASRSQQLSRPASHPAPGKRRARRSPGRAPERHASEQQRSTRAGDRSRRRGSPVSASATRRSARSAASRSGRGEKTLSTIGSENRPSSGPREDVGSDVKRGLTTFLTVPPTPALFSVASEVVTGSGSGGFPVTSLTILTLLGITALTLAGGGIAPKWRPPRLRRRDPDRFASANGRPTSALTLPEDREAFGAKQNGEAILAEEMAVPLQEVAASFAPITLAVLEEQAALATRAERKYVLDVRTFERLIGELIPHHLILDIDGERVFPYDTIYFDTPTRTTYHQHLQERRRRFKARTRLYSGGGPCFFEVKLKGGRGQTIKHRLEFGVEEHGSLTGPALAFLEQKLQQAYGASPPDALAPSLRTSYRRLTLAGRTGAERLTFDFGLMFAANGNEYSIQPGRILLETKTDVGAGETNGSAGQAKRVLRRLGVRPVGSCSKYCLGMALAHPELRDNLFRPLIRRYFDPHRHPRPGACDNGEVPPPVVELGGEHQPVFLGNPAWQQVLSLLTRRSSA